MAIEQTLLSFLERRKAELTLRSLKSERPFIDFSSNDYLGLAANTVLRDRILDEICQNNLSFGSTGSRLLTGQTDYAEQVERELTEFYKGEAGLIFNSGYDANVALLSAVPGRSDTILYDALVHASMREGIRLSLAKSWSFAHNDLNDLEEKLKRAEGQIFIAVESIYSMDGDAPDLAALTILAEKYKAALIVDEAHSTGIFGEKGEGMMVEKGLADACFARVHTFGKAVGCQGAMIVGSETLRHFLINSARPFIYTTAPAPAFFAALRCAHRILPELNAERAQLFAIRDLFFSLMEEHKGHVLGGTGAIAAVQISGADNVRFCAEKLQKWEFDVRPILSPTVAKGAERLRLCFHSYNVKEEMIELTGLLRYLLKEY